jgi:hypothetical protein
MPLDGGPYAAASCCDTSLVKRVGNLLGCNSASRTYVGNDWHKILIPFLHGCTSHGSTSGIALLGHDPHAFWASTLPPKCHTTCLGCAKRGFGARGDHHGLVLGYGS